MDNDILVIDLSYGHERQPKDHWFFSAERSQGKWYPGVIAPITVRPRWVRSYYHWMFEVLPRVHLLRQSEWAIDAIAVHRLTEPFQVETFELLGLRDDDLTIVGSPTRLRAAQMVVTPVLPAIVPPWACVFLRGLMLDEAITQDGSDRIYVTRERARRGRKVENEGEVTRELEKRGFRTVMLEGMSVRDQARMFAEAEYIVAPHGSGLANLVFCNPGTTVVEMFSPTYVHPLYWLLSNRLGLRYYYLVGCGCRHQEWDAWPTSEGLEGIDIEIEHLTTILKYVGL
jgi:capsular polysaccharide biosynthesis protein